MYRIGFDMQKGDYVKSGEGEEDSKGLDCVKECWIVLYGIGIHRRGLKSVTKGLRRTSEVRVNSKRIRTH